MYVKLLYLAFHFSTNFIFSQILATHHELDTCSWIQPYICANGNICTISVTTHYINYIDFLYIFSDVMTTSMSIFLSLNFGTTYL